MQEVRKQSWQALSDTALQTIKAKWQYAGNGYVTATDKWIADVIRQRKEQQHTKAAA